VEEKGEREKATEENKTEQEMAMKRDRNGRKEKQILRERRREGKRKMKATKTS